MSWYIQVLQKYAVFDGRARRKEYWMFFIINTIIFIIYILILVFAYALIVAVGRDVENVTPFYLVVAFGIIYYLGTFIPGIAVSARRLHDTDRSGWWILVGYVLPFIGGIVLLFFFTLKGKEGENKYGPDPKETMSFSTSHNDTSPSQT